MPPSTSRTPRRRFAWNPRMLRTASPATPTPVTPTAIEQSETVTSLDASLAELPDTPPAQPAVAAVAVAVATAPEETPPRRFGVRVHELPLGQARAEPKPLARFPHALAMPKRRDDPTH